MKRLLPFLLLSIFGCKETIKTELWVHDNTKTFWAIQENRFVKVPPGVYDLTLEIQESSKKQSTMIIVDQNTRETLVEARLTLPPAKDVLTSLENVELSARELSQAFSMVIQRRVDFKEDHYGLSFYDPVHKQNIGSASFGYKPKEANFDEETQSYLRSYQNVKRRHRAVVFAIDGNLDKTLKIPDLLAGTVDIIVNYGAALLVSPWAYVRYSEVIWILGNKTEDEEFVEKMWAKALRKSPVVDFMAFVHAGRDTDIAEQTNGLHRKRNQLRYVYTSACHSGSAEDYIIDYNAAAAVGHPGMSASPLFSLSIFRHWSYGRSLASSIARSFKSGRARIETLSSISKHHIEKHWGSVKGMIDSSEPMVSWTPELPPHQIFVTLSAIPSRETERERQVYEMTASNTGGPTPVKRYAIASLSH